MEDLRKWIQQHNNKVGILNVAYAIAKHYFNKEIPDDPWYISPGRQGQFIEYMPYFKQEHWLYRFWFHFYIEFIYNKFFSIWDSIIGFINIFYQMEIDIEDLRFRQNVMKKLETINPTLHNILTLIRKDPVYIKANKYRTSIVHGFPPGDIDTRTIRTYDPKGTIYDIDNNGNLIAKKIEGGVYSISMNLGKYVTTREFMVNIDNFITLTGDKILEIINMIKEDIFKYKLKRK